MSAVGSPQIQAIQKQVVFNTGTTQFSTQTTTIDLGDVYCYSVELEVPNGPHGVLFFYMQYAGTQILPWGPNGTYLNVDDYTHTFPVDAELAKGLQVVGYNLGNFTHTVFFRFLATPIAAYRANNLRAPTPAIDLSGLGG